MADPSGALIPIIAVLATVVGLVGFFVKWLIAQATKASEAAILREAACLEKVSLLEGRVQRLEEDARVARSEKHQAFSERAAYLGSLKVIRQLFGTLDLEQFAVALPKLLDAIPDREDPAA